MSKGQPRLNIDELRRVEFETACHPYPSQTLNVLWTSFCRLRLLLLLNLLLDPKMLLDLELLKMVELLVLLVKLLPDILNLLLL